MISANNSLNEKPANNELTCYPTRGNVFLQMTRGGKEASVCLHKFSLSNNYMSSLRTTACDALIVPSDADKMIFDRFRRTYDKD